MGKKLSIALLTVSLLLSSLIGGASAATFSDVSGHWAAEDIAEFSDLGLINGKAPGVFAPSDNVTRAEFTAILNRAFPAAPEKSGAAADFSDVSAGQWFYEDIAKASAAGLAKGSDGSFRPYDPITRQDAAVLLQRYLTGSGMRGHFYRDFWFADRQFLSAYAADSVFFLYRHNIISGYEDSSLRPQNPINRAESVVISNRAYKLLHRDAPHIEDFIQLLDGSTVTKPLSDALMLSLTDMDPYSLVTHGKTDAAIKNVINGKKDLALVTYPSEENLKLAKSKGVNLVIVPIVNDAFVFMVNRDNPIDSLTIQQVKDIYSGKITNWKEVGGLDVPILPLQRNADSGSQSGMLDFMGDTPIKVPFEDSEVAFGMGWLIERVTEDSTAIGYSYYYYASGMYESNAKLIALEGIAPSNENIAAGKYPEVTQYYAVFRASEPTDGFARWATEYLLSPAGQALAAEEGYVPLLDTQIQTLPKPTGTPITRPAPLFYLNELYTKLVLHEDVYYGMVEALYPPYRQIFSDSWALARFLHSVELDMATLQVADCYSDITITPEPSQEALDYATAKGIELEMTAIASNSVAFFVHPDNPVNNLTKQQLSDIFNEKITNWKDVGGPDAPIVLCLSDYNEDVARGAAKYVLAYIGRTTPYVWNDDYSNYSYTYDLDYEPYGIGYAFYTDYRDRLPAVQIDGVAPSDSRYPLQAAYYSIFRKSEPAPSFARTFTEYLLSAEVQKEFQKLGYLPAQ